MAVTEAEGTSCEGNSTTGIDGSAKQEETDAASACHSFWEEVGREAGAKGSRFSAGFVQQTGVVHFPQPDLQQAQFGLCATEGGSPAPADTVKTPCHARSNPSRITSGVFASRIVMALVQSV